MQNYKFDSRCVLKNGNNHLNDVLGFAIKLSLINKSYLCVKIGKSLFLEKF